MNVYVCVKEIQNPEIAASVFRVDETKNEVIPVPGLPLVTSPFDEQAVEAALRIRDKLPDTKIKVVCFGPATSRAAIKRALSMGADEGIYISDKGIEAVDGRATARVLAAALRKANDVGLILTGRQAADWDAGLVGCGIAELLEIPAVTFAKSVHVSDNKVTVERVLDEGFETVEASAPCVVTISNELGDPRKASLRETMRAAKKPVTEWNAADLGLDREKLITNAAVLRERLYIPVKEGSCELIAGDTPQQIAQRLAERLFNEKII